MLHDGWENFRVSGETKIDEQVIEMSLQIQCQLWKSCFWDSRQYIFSNNQNILVRFSWQLLS